MLATGLGKTLLAVLDYAQLRNELNRRPRLLFLAHRRELLRQAAGTYRQQLRELGETASVGWCAGDDGELDADLVFASVAKLARAEHLERLRKQRFDYVVVDEVHHAAAASYRKILDALDPGFLLGLTATPDRADAADILGLFDDFIAYQAGIGRGIELQRLVPFHYFGVKDDIDYANIPWRNKRFDPEELARAAQTEARMLTLWRAWQEHPGSRTLVFCCSIEHAKFVRGWLGEQGLSVKAIFSAEGSDNRDEALDDFKGGRLDALCAVDVLNEGIDVPAIDRVVMLRPTESGVIFLQQLGRGLRASDGKDSVTVIDFVGNHRVFLERVRTLLSLAGATETRALRAFLEASEPRELPAGCSVDLELEAKELLKRLFRVGGADEVERVYRELRLERGERPTAGELQRMGYLPSRIRERHGSWFEFVQAEGDLGQPEESVLATAKAFLREVEIAEMTKCFKMVTLDALLEAGKLGAGLPLGDLAERSRRILRRSPELLEDVADNERDADEAKWLAYWRGNPIKAWTSKKRGRRTWFKLDGERFLLDLAIDPELEPAFADLVRELVDYRLAQYRARKRKSNVSPDGFVCKVTWNQRDPILKLPSRKSATLPEGETDVRLRDGAVWQFRFAKEYCNVARPAGAPSNQLPDLLRRWFGPSAGQPGTDFQVRFRASPDGLWVEPVQAEVIELAPRRGIVAYPELRAAAGHPQGGGEVVDRESLVLLPLDSADPDLFAVRVSGTSMDGGKKPLREGDWAVMRVARGAPASALEDRVVLVQVPDEPVGSQYQIKRLKRDGSGWKLLSDNPDGPSFQGGVGMVPIARLERAVRPEELAPPQGSVLAEGQLADGFGLDVQPSTERYDGHLFVFIDRKGLLEEPDRLRGVGIRPRPGETAYVLAKRRDGSWRYLGVAHPIDDGDAWRLPSVDYETWRAWGSGRQVSNDVPEGALRRAQLAADALLALPESDRWLTQIDGARARVLGRAQRGGLRIDGGEGGFGARTVSLTDIAWVVAADEDVRQHGGRLDEERVNRLRYLEGTPKSSTRWIDTGWAIAAWTAGKPLMHESVRRRVRRDNGEVIDAEFTVEFVAEQQTVAIESGSGERFGDYAEGLELILARLAQHGFRIADALVDSNVARRLPLEERRLDLGSPYPVAIDGARELRDRMSRAQRSVARKRGAKGSGNQTRRLRLMLVGGEGVSDEELARRLEGRS